MQTVDNLSEALLNLKKSKFDLVMVGHAVPELKIKSIVKPQNTSATLFRFCSSSLAQNPRRDNSTWKTEEEELWRMVGRMCGEKQGKR